MTHWATAALQDRDWLHNKVRLIVAERERMVAQLAQFGRFALPAANCQ